MVYKIPEKYSQLPEKCKKYFHEVSVKYTDFKVKSAV